MSDWISHAEAREIVGGIIFADDWIGSLTSADLELLNGQYGPKRRPRPNGASGFFEIIQPCPSALRRKLDAAIGRDRRMIVQHTTVLEWLDQNGFPALDKRYVRQDIEAKIHTQGAEKKPVARGRRGPAKGAIARYANDDRSKFPQMKRLIDGGLTTTAAAAKLADQLKGGGTLESRATRLRKLFQQEVP